MADVNECNRKEMKTTVGNGAVGLDLKIVPDHHQVKQMKEQSLGALQTVLILFCSFGVGVGG